MFSILSRKCICGIRNIRSIKYLAGSVRKFSEDKSNDSKNKPEKLSEDILGLISKKYQVFRNEDSFIIHDINEERFSPPTIQPDEDEIADLYKGLNLTRGSTGVYSIEDLVQVLHRENAIDIFVAAVQPGLKYVDYICIVTGKSYRHMLAIAYLVRKIYKIKRHSSDILPKIEGETSKEWIAMDLGNIALHIFSEAARVKYDLESLWSLGQDYDDESNKPEDPFIELLKSHSIYIGDLEPDNSKT